MMKFACVIPSSILASLLMPCASSESLFAINDPIPVSPTTWNIESSGTNVVIIDFELQGEDPSYFTSAVLDCEAVPNPAYAVSATGDPSGSVEVTFTNQIQIVSPVSFCFVIELSLNGYGILASKRVSYAVTFDESGNTNVEVELGADELVVRGAGNTTFRSEITLAGQDPNIQVKALGGPYYLSEVDEIELEVTGTDGYYFRVDSLAPSDVTHRGGEAAQGKTSLFISNIPVPYWAAGYLLLELSVAWDTNGFETNRRLAPSDEEGVDPNGSESFLFPIQLGASPDLSSDVEENQHYKTSFPIVFILAIAGTALALFIGLVFFSSFKKKSHSYTDEEREEELDTSSAGQEQEGLFV